MADIEKVMNGLECCSSSGECDHCRYSTMNNSEKGRFAGCYQLHIDALELLKEQNGLAKALEQMIATNAYLNAEKERLKNLLEHREAEVAILSRSSIVRCKDCKYSTDHSHEFQKQPYRCTWRGGFNDGDWFCAGGVRKDGEKE